MMWVTVTHFYGGQLEYKDDVHFSLVGNAGLDGCTY